MEPDEIGAVEPGHYLADLVDVDAVGAVATKEPLGRQPTDELAEGHGHHVAIGTGVDMGQLLVGFRVVDLLAGGDDQGGSTL